jgi:hypothetical protein
MGQRSAQDFSQLPKGGEKPVQDVFARPYINVIRMHLLIFFFAACYALKVESFLVYTVVYAVYFFPWKVLLTTAETRTDSLIRNSPRP